MKPKARGYKVILPIGDWSGDGHEECVYYHVSSSRPIEDVRKVHGNIEDITGIDIYSICNEYLDNLVSKDKIFELEELGFKADSISKDEVYNRVTLKGGIRLDKEDLVSIWVYLLNITEPSLRLKLEGLVVEDTGIPQLRGEDYVGYGCFKTEESYLEPIIY